MKQIPKVQKNRIEVINECALFFGGFPFGPQFVCIKVCFQNRGITHVLFDFLVVFYCWVVRIVWCVGMRGISRSGFFISCGVSYLIFLVDKRVFIICRVGVLEWYCLFLSFGEGFDLVL